MRRERKAVASLHVFYYASLLQTKKKTTTNTRRPDNLFPVSVGSTPYFHYHQKLLSCSTTNININDKNNKTMMNTNNNLTTTNGDDIIVEIDGSQGEGGGQILRNSVSYATILQRPIRIYNIRGKRNKPGLQAQHAAAITLAATIGRGTLHGATLQSSEIIYYPPLSSLSSSSSSSPGGDGDDVDNDNSQQQQQQKEEESETNIHKERVFTGSIPTAGSICLLLQAALPCALLIPPTNHGTTTTTTSTSTITSSTKLILHGGTNAQFAPQYDYWEQIFVPTIRRLFFNRGGEEEEKTKTKKNKKKNLQQTMIQATVLMRGYYPRGGGHVEVNVPCLTMQQMMKDDDENSTSLPTLPLPSFQLTERGKHITRIYIRSFHAGKLPRHLASQMAKAAQTRLEEYFQKVVQQSNDSIPIIDVEIVTEPKAVGNGLGILIIATTSTGCLLGGSALCKPKDDKRIIGQQAAQELIDTIQDGGCVDEYLQDQLILYMALAKGVSTLRTGSLTLHTQTAIQIAQQLVPGVVITVQRIAEEDNEDYLRDQHNASTTTTTSSRTSTNDSNYGKHGRIAGQHMITCHGIGYTGTDFWKSHNTHQKRKR